MVTTAAAGVCALLLLHTAVCGVGGNDFKVSLEVLQFHNPTGTTFPGTDFTANRKCCDTRGATNCSSTETCDVLFNICVGSVAHRPAAVCAGARFQMPMSLVFNDTNFISSRLAHSRLGVFTGELRSWKAGSTEVHADSFDIDQIFHAELIDNGTAVVNFAPSGDFSYWTAVRHVVSFTHFTALDVAVRVWCRAGMFGPNCDSPCQGGDFYHCVYNAATGRTVFASDCPSKEIHVLRLNVHNSTYTREELERKLTLFVANSFCIANIRQANVSLLHVRYHRNNLHLQFTASCVQIYIGSVVKQPVPSIRLEQTLYLNSLLSTPRNDVSGLVTLLESGASNTTSIANGNTARLEITCFKASKVVTAMKAVTNERQWIRQTYDPDQEVQQSKTLQISWARISCAHILRVYQPIGSKERCVETNGLLQSDNLTSCSGYLTDLNSTVSSVIDSPASSFLIPIDVATVNVSTITLKVHLAYQGNRYQITEHQLKNLSSLSWADSSTNSPVTEEIFHNHTTDTTIDIEYTAWCEDGYHGHMCQSRSMSEIGPHCIPRGTSLPTTSTMHVFHCRHGHCQQEGVCKCDDGFTSRSCAADIDECGLEYCVNAAACTNTPGSFHCQCLPGFTGTRCDVDMDDCTSNPCLHDGTCVNMYGSFFCLCRPGFTGDTCQTNDLCASNPCANGRCSTSLDGFKCSCHSGFTGTLCDKRSDFCLYHTIYICGHYKDCTGSPAPAGSCGCQTGWQGTMCDIDVNECDEYLCADNARCKNSPGNYSCDCGTGFTGPNCETDIDECSSSISLCRNGATCVDGIANYTCVCPSGFSGPTCDNTHECEASKKTLCENGGTCYNTGNDYSCNCPPGYTGRNCSIDIDDCSSNPCQNGATCDDLVNGYSCNCAPGYTGHNCSVDIDDCSSTPCQNGATCQDLVNDYSCDCAPGYTGHNCRVDIDDCSSTPCQNGATCDDHVIGYSCNCAPGYTGRDCSIDIDDCSSTPCQNGATCQDLVNGYSCNCAPGYTGRDCSIDIDDCSSTPCQNGATCDDHVNGYSCNCAPGYTGRDCSIDIDDCSSTPCQNGATCDDHVNGYSCNCAPGYTGQDCSIDIDDCSSTPCQNGATCDDHVNGYSCHCASGYTGQDCSIDIDDCSSTPCQNGATCDDHVNGYSCNCAPGYTGQDCSIDIDDCSIYPCQNGATCDDHVNGYSCNCAPGYTGRDCSIDINECTLFSNPCQNGGTCQDQVNSYTCQCAPGYEGRNCSVNINECTLFSNPCQNGGTCQDQVNNYTCQCAPGYKGRNCSVDINECTLFFNPCQNGGTCQDQVNNYTCQCAPGYKGRNCSVDINECTLFSNPCQNGGTCQDQVNNYTCQCAPGYKGRNCSTISFGCESNNSVCRTENKGPVCFTCDDLSHPFLCNIVKRCKVDEVCYLDKYSIYPGEVRYRSGCRIQTGCRPQPDGCPVCCHSNLCNGRGCGDTGLPAPGMRGPICYDCSHVLSHDECHRVKLCKATEVCAVEKFEWGDIYSQYSFGCEHSGCSPSLLRRLSRRSPPVCRSCCSSDLCNTDCSDPRIDPPSQIIG